MSPSTSTPPAPIAPASITTANVAVVVGTLSSDPRVTHLPSGDTIVNYEISTETPDGRLSVPVQIAGGARLPALKAADTVVAIGPVRRRFFRAGGATMSRTEVVARVIGKPGSARVAKAVAAVGDALASGGVPQAREG